jgi:hypothetical protein
MLRSISVDEIAVSLHHCLEPGLEALAGLQHSVSVNAAYHLLDLVEKGVSQKCRDGFFVI